MFDEQDGDLGVVLGVVFGILALVIALVIGVGTYQLRSATAAPAAAQPAVEEIVYVDIVEVGDPLVKIYFDVGQKTLPADAGEAVNTVVQALQAAPESRALVSGFHDESGGAAINAEVAKQRALSVRDALLAAGISADRVLLRRPAVTLGGGDAAEARRVEVRVQ